MKRIIYMICMLLGCSCSQREHPDLTLSGLNPQHFIAEVNHKQTRLFTLRNQNDMEVCITNYGGRIVSVMVPDRKGTLQDVVLGFDSIADYLKHRNSYGATMGRVTNRIAHGTFNLDGVDYQLATGKDGHTLHGGKKGFRFQVFDADQTSPNELILSYLSRDGEEGFPGNLSCKVTMRITDDNCLDIQYEAETDRSTIINMTNHSFFNLDADPTLSNASNILQIDADNYTPIDNATRLPTGEIAKVEQTIFDFRTPHPLGEAFHHQHNSDVVDINFVLNHPGDITHPCARLYSPQTGIALYVYTNEPGLQVLASNKDKKTVMGKKNMLYHHNSSVCLETQKFPDSPNHPSWPSSILRPGEKYRSHCIYRFTTE